MNNDVRVYAVGGSIRDEILGVPNKDFDFSVEAGSFDIMRDYIKSIGGEIFLETPEFVTIRARVGKIAADYVLCRKDGTYSDGRRPDNVTIGTIYDDLARRDFTINAIAKDENGNYLDPFGGIADINRKLIRCVGNTYDRISEDYLRLLRAARFSITKGFSISSEIEVLFVDTNILNHIIYTVSQDRIREELGKMFAYNTLESIHFFGMHYLFSMACFGKNSNIWLKPTNEKR
jgi:tRNA nucleotidyltransferase/poly(A) polymerase